MNTKTQRFPTRQPATPGDRLGCHRRIAVVSPFLRAHYALRRGGMLSNETTVFRPLLGGSLASGRTRSSCHAL
jgi:hypothetical protein